MGARIAQSNASISGNSAVPFISYELGGKANNGAPLYQPQHNNFAPRFGFSYNPNWSKKTVFNGSAGMVYDRTIVNALLTEQNEYSYLFQLPTSVPFGIAGDPYTSLATDPRLGANLVPLNPPPAAPTAPYTPFVAGGVPVGLDRRWRFQHLHRPELEDAVLHHDDLRRAARVPRRLYRQG